MKPVIEINKQKKLITTKLAPNMGKAEIYEFIDELYAVLKQCDTPHSEFTLLSDSTHKSFTDLDSAFEMADNFRKLLESNHIKKFAVYNPNNDYYSENEINYPKKFKTFDNEILAKEWLLN